LRFSDIVDPPFKDEKSLDMASPLYHIAAGFALDFRTLNRITLLDKLVEEATLDKALVPDPEHEFTVFVIREFSQFIDADTRIGSGFF